MTKVESKVKFIEGISLGGLEKDVNIFIKNKIDPQVNIMHESTHCGNRYIAIIQYKEKTIIEESRDYRYTE